MADVHQLILQHGIEETRRQAVSKHDRQVVEAAYRVLCDDAEKMGFTYTGFALTNLPHKPQQHRRGDAKATTSRYAAGGRDRTEKSIGLPYGSYARFILLFLAERGYPHPAPARSISAAACAYGSAYGPFDRRRDLQAGEAQARRISGCTLMFFSDRAGSEIKSRGGFVRPRHHDVGDLTTSPGFGRTASCSTRISIALSASIRCPLSESALRAIGPRTMVIDVYIWLAYRLHSLTRDVEVSWPALHAQFGAGYTRLRAFRAHFLEALNLAAAVYPEANLSIGDRGVILRPSRPAIPKL